MKLSACPFRFVAAGSLLLLSTVHAAERLPDLPAGSAAPVTVQLPPASPALLAQTATDQTLPRLRRSESFLGLHFDFHAGPDCKEVGKNTTRAMIENLIDLVQPDYIQIDGKGHPGYSSYPTRVGNPVPGFAGDLLRLWRDVTSSRGVALYLHYSGVFDMHAVKNPGWAAINAEGQPHARATSLWGPYTDKLLIPQLREIAGDYNIDGVWVDGDCWSTTPDYTPAALEAFHHATGITTVPRKAGDPHWFEFMEFHREAFRRYLRHYVTEVKKTHPAFQICSNWAYSDRMPEPVGAPVDFLSGDCSPGNSVNHARVVGRYLARQGLPWDLMAWSFFWSRQVMGGKTMPKPVVQVQREAAVILALGGGFQAYYKQKRDGSIHDEEVPGMAEIAKFCRARQAFSHRSEAVPQIAVLLSTDDQYRRNAGLFSRSLARVQGLLVSLLQSQYSVEVLGEHQLTGRLGQYPLVVVPECDYLAPAFRKELADYIQTGGCLLLVGPGSARLFERELDIRLHGEPNPATGLQLAHAGADSELHGGWQAVTLGPNARAVGRLRVTNSQDVRSQPAASITSRGGGEAAAIYFTAGQIYAQDRPAALREFLHALARELFPRPLVEVKGSRDVDVVVARNQGQLLVHLVNTSGDHETQPILPSIAPIGPLDITVLSATKPSRVTLEPGARSRPFTYRNGEVKLTVPRLDIYEIVVVQAP